MKSVYYLFVLHLLTLSHRRKHKKQYAFNKTRVLVITVAYKTKGVTSLLISIKMKVLKFSFQESMKRTGKYFSIFLL